MAEWGFLGMGFPDGDLLKDLNGIMLTFWAQVYAILDEVFLAGEIEETSKQVVLTRLEHLDKLE